MCWLVRLVDRRDIGCDEGRSGPRPGFVEDECEDGYFESDGEAVEVGPLVVFVFLLTVLLLRSVVKPVVSQGG